MLRGETAFLGQKNCMCGNLIDYMKATDWFEEYGHFNDVEIF